MFRALLHEPTRAARHLPTWRKPSSFNRELVCTTLDATRRPGPLSIARSRRAVPVTRVGATIEPMTDDRYGASWRINGERLVVLGWPAPSSCSSPIR